MAYDDDDEIGPITSAMSNPWISVPYAALSGVAAAATPGLARGVNVGNAVLQAGMGAERQNYGRKKERGLGDDLNRLADLTRPVTVPKKGLDPKTTTFSLPGGSQRLDEALSGLPGESRVEEELVTGQPSMRAHNLLAPPSPLPTYQTTEERPIFSPVMRQYLKSIGKYSPQTAAEVLGKQLIKDPQKPITVGPSSTVFDPETGRAIYTAPAAPDKEQWQPFQTDLGDRVIIGAVNRATGERRVEQVQPKAAAPAQPKSPEELALLNARTGAANAAAAQSLASAGAARAQTERLREITRRLGDPKTTRDQLLADRNSLVAERKSVVEQIGYGEPTPADQQRLADIDTLLDDSRSRLAERIKIERGEQGSAADDPLSIRSGARRGGEY